MIIFLGMFGYSADLLHCAWVGVNGSLIYKIFVRKANSEDSDLDRHWFSYHFHQIFELLDCSMPCLKPFELPFSENKKNGEPTMEECTTLTPINIH